MTYIKCLTCDTFKLFFITERVGPANTIVTSQIVWNPIVVQYPAHMVHKLVAVVETGKL